MAHLCTTISLPDRVARRARHEKELEVYRLVEFWTVEGRQLPTSTDSIMEVGEVGKTVLAFLKPPARDLDSEDE